MANARNCSAGLDRAETIIDNRFTWPEERPAGIAAEQIFDNFQGPLPDLSHESGWVPRARLPCATPPSDPSGRGNAS